MAEFHDSQSLCSHAFILWEKNLEHLLFSFLAPGKSLQAVESPIKNEHTIFLAAAA
jgi:hypothetical protein